jgi:hypothetical protein
MLSNLITSAKTSVRPVDVRVVLFLISIALFVIGAGAPAATGG